MKRILALAAFSCLMYTVYAGGFQVYLQGTRQSGMGLTGVGLPLDAASLSLNPGAVALLPDRNAVMLGGHLIYAATAYREPNPGTYTAATVNNPGTPFNAYAMYSFGAEKQYTAGLAVYTPYGSGTRWPDDWMGRFTIQEASLKTIYIQPTFSVRIGDKLGFGAGPIIATGSFMMRKALPLNSQDGSEGSVVLNGGAKGYGFNAGAEYQITNEIFVGLDYRSALKAIVADGSADFTVPTSLGSLFPDTKFSTGLTMPAMTSLGLGYRNANGLSLAADVNFVGWNVYDSLVIDFTDNTSSLSDLHSARNYQNSVALRFGGAYEVGSNIEVRGGAFYDFTPIPTGYLTPETPDSDKLGVTLGLGLKFGKGFGADLSLLYIEGAMRDDINLETNFGGTFKTRALLPGFSISYTW